MLKRGCVDQIYRRLREVLFDKTGSVLILTAVSAPLLLLTIGFAADYGYASYINQRLARAADTAVLSATSQSAAATGGGYADTNYLQLAGTTIFNENIKDLPISNVSFNLTVNTDSSGIVTATGRYSYSLNTFFSGAFGISVLPMSGAVQSIVHPTSYLNYYLVTDTSQSMGIAATQTDMQTLYDRVVANRNGSNGDVGCVFACHEKAESVYYNNKPQPYTNEDLAHNLTRNWGPLVTLRIDAAVTAVQNIISSANAIAGANKNIGIGLYTIRTDASDGSNLGVISSVSTNYSNLAALANTIKLGGTYPFGSVYSGSGASDFKVQLSQFNSSLSANGSGASSSSPKNYVFLITDGFDDTANSSQNCVGLYNCFPVFDPTFCNTIKAKATLGIIYTTYLPIYQNNNSSQGLEHLFASAVGYSQRRDLLVLPALQACATSSDFFFQADDGPALIAAMQSLFLKTQPLSARLTQ